LSIDQGNPQLFFLRGVDKNAFHVVFSVSKRETPGSPVQ
jgi:hypothetical protein